MSKVKLLTIAVIVLLALNTAFLFYGFPKHRPPHGEGPKMLIIEKLHFDKNQQEQYENLIHWHRVTIDSLDKQILETKNLLYGELLHKEDNKKVQDSLIDEIANYQKLIEKTHLMHFRDIKKICKPEQLQYYNALTQELAALFSKPPRKKHD